jgi:hypothetical protein
MDQPRQRRPLTRNIAISVPPEKIEFMDRRAAVLGISRSQYLCQLVRADLRRFAKELALDSHPALKKAIDPVRL